MSCLWPMCLGPISLSAHSLAQPWRCCFHMTDKLPRVLDQGTMQGYMIKAIFHYEEFSAWNDIFFCLKTNWQRVSVKRKYHSMWKIVPFGKQPFNPILHGVFWITKTNGGPDSARPPVTQPF